MSSSESPVNLHSFSLVYKGCKIVVGDKRHDVIGVGGQGVVYRATVFDVDGRPLGQKFMLKAASPIGTSTVEDRRREAGIMQRVERVSITRDQIPAIPRALALIETGSQNYILMEEAPGKRMDFALREFRKTATPATMMQTVIGIADQLLQTALILETKEKDSDGEILHRDMTPGNILVDLQPGSRTYGKTSLVDFGIAVDTNTPSDRGSGDTFGSPLWLSPQQCLMINDDTTTNRFQIGLLLLEGLTGDYEASRVRWHTDNPLLAMAATIDSTYLQIARDVCKRHRDTVSPELEAFIMKAIAYEPSVRFQSALEMRVALQEIKRTLEDRGALRR